MATLEFIGQAVVHVPVSYSWISTKRFRIHGEATDESLLQALIDHVQYADAYAGGEVDERRPPVSQHGPYERAAISVGTFVPSDAAVARDRLATWATACATVGRPADPADLARFLAEDLPAVVEAADAHFYELPDIRAAAEHEWGWVVGADGFHEFVGIDRDTCELTLIVASDD